MTCLMATSSSIRLSFITCIVAEVAQSLDVTNLLFLDIRLWSSHGYRYCAEVEDMP